jgi:5'-nucleotidase
LGLLTLRPLHLGRTNLNASIHAHGRSRHRRRPGRHALGGCGCDHRARPELRRSVHAAEIAAEPFISEIHYDNSGTDSGEAVEIEAPGGFDLTGWQIVLYNGSGGSAYNTSTLSGVVPAAGVVVQTYPANGIQNGAPDGVALVNAAGAVAEFLTYEGTFTASGGPAAGVAGVDIGVAERHSTPAADSLQKVDGTWQAPAATLRRAQRGPPDPETRSGADPGCTTPVTHTIAEVQGTGAATGLAGTRVTVEGVVTADHRTGGYNGIVVQTAGSGGDRPLAAGTASDGIFVYLTSNNRQPPVGGHR